MSKTKTPADIKEIIVHISFNFKRRLELFRHLSPEVRATVLLRLTRHIQYEIVNNLSDEELLSVLENLDPDDATDMVQLLSQPRQKIVIPKLNDELKKGVELLFQFDPNTAAGLMNVDYIQVNETDTIKEVAKKFKAHELRTGRPPAIIVMQDGKVQGYLPGHELALNSPANKIQKHIKPVPTLKHDARRDDVVEVFKSHPHNKVAITGDRGNVIGIIYSDDILKVLEEQESASLYDFAGVREEESVTDPTSVKVKNRYKWLIINLGTAFLAAFTVGLFEETISKYVLLAVYMPIVAGMGGNAATQTLAVLVRGIALKQISLQNAWLTFKRELSAGFINGVINGILVAAIVLVINKDAKIALILALAMVVNLMVAAIFGTLVPLVMKRFGKDPATSATIFITTATDVLGFLAFLGLATWILN